MAKAKNKQNVNSNTEPINTQKTPNEPVEENPVENVDIDDDIIDDDEQVDLSDIEEQDEESENEIELEKDDEVLSEDGKSIESDKEDEKPEDSNCLYKYIQGGDSDEEYEEVFDDDLEQKNTADIVPKEQRISKPFLFKYERVRLIGDRTKQLSLGAKPLIKGVEHLPPKQIAELEWF